MDDAKPEAAEEVRTKKRRSARRVLRAIHRDAGYLAVGLTLVYAISGLAVNHLEDWDPNFVEVEQRWTLGPLEGEPDSVAAAVLARTGVAGPIDEVYEETADELSILVGESTLHVTRPSGEVYLEGRRPRFLLRAINWLHLNRGKKAWTYVADAYAVALLFLALSGIVMLPGKKGLIGRGGLMVAAGVAVPILYVTLSGGP